MALLTCASNREPGGDDGVYGTRRGMGRLSAAVDLCHVVLAVYLGVVCVLAFLHPVTSGHEGAGSLVGICLTRVFSSACGCLSCGFWLPS